MLHVTSLQRSNLGFEETLHITPLLNHRIVKHNCSLRVSAAKPNCPGIYEQLGFAQLTHAILSEARELFAGGELSEDDKLTFLMEMQQLFLDSKKRAKKYTPRKYLREEADE